MTLNAALCIATGTNLCFICKNNRRDVGTGAQPRLVVVGINSGNVVHSNVVHTMRISEQDPIFEQVLLPCISGALVQ